MATDKSALNSPLVRQMETGHLMCLACNQQVKSKVWTAHANGRQHRQRVADLKVKLSAGPSVPAVKEVQGKKRTAADSTNGPDSKRLKENTKSQGQNDALPKDFFDSNGNDRNKAATSENKPVVEEEQMDAVAPWQKPREEEKAATVDLPKANTVESLPKGFFDDPAIDKKVRKEEKDPMEEEWNRFQREMQQTEQQSSSVIQEDEEHANVERSIEEIDEQIMEWARVNDLQKRKEDNFVINPSSTDFSESNATGSIEDTNNDSDEDIDVDEILDWRCKKI